VDHGAGGGGCQQVSDLRNQSVGLVGCVAVVVRTAAYVERHGKLAGGCRRLHWGEMSESYIYWFVLHCLHVALVASAVVPIAVVCLPALRRCCQGRVVSVLEGGYRIQVRGCGGQGREARGGGGQGRES
jgi:hypothetical protein